MKKYLKLSFCIILTLFLLSSCTFNKGLKMSMLHSENFNILLTQKDPKSIEPASEIDITDLLNIDDELMLLLTLLKLYPHVELNFTGKVDFMSVESDSAEGAAELYKAVEKFLAGIENEND